MARLTGNLATRKRLSLNAGVALKGWTTLKYSVTVLLEDFKNCVPNRIAIYIEQKVSKVSEAAVLADEYATPGGPKSRWWISAGTALYTLRW